MARSSIFVALAPATQSKGRRSSSRGGRKRCRHGRIRRNCKKRHPNRSRSRSRTR